VSDFVDVREPQTEKLLFRYDPDRDIIEVQRRGVKTLVDLRQYQERQERQDAKPIYHSASLQGNIQSIA
jgi:hypothetical protein